MSDTPDSALRIVEQAARRGLDVSLLYETVISLAEEGLLTARCVDAAAGILLTQLGLPEYFFRNISRDALTRILRTIAGNMQLHQGQFVLRSEVSEAAVDVEGGVQVRIATPENRDRMEAVLEGVMSGQRVEYYFGREHQYYTYIIRPEVCGRLSEIKPGESPFAFARVRAGPAIPEPTRARYEAFLAASRTAVVPLVEVSPAPAADETRIMFKDDFSRSALPVIRRMLTDLRLTLTRAYWETYRGATDRVESVCSLYVAGTPEPAQLEAAVARLHALLSIQAGDLDELYVTGRLEFDEFIFAVAACAFVHTFIHKDLATDRVIFADLDHGSLRQVLARRVYDSNRAEYTRQGILQTVRQRPDLIQRLFRLFEARFDPRRTQRLEQTRLEAELRDVRRSVAIAFVDDRTGEDVFAFMTRLITDVYKTSFYKVRKRACSFRLAPTVLDPLVFPGKVYGVFLVVGFHAVATHMRADDVARGGVRLVRVTPGNYENELDNMPLLNYALGPVAQRLKHKDIAESGAKGVIVPAPAYAPDGLNAMLDFAEGILDLIQPSPEVLDYLGRPEMVFFGPDEGTAGFMDQVALRARERGYEFWRTLTTGKTSGIPHDTYGLTTDGSVFALLNRGAAGTEIQVDGRTVALTPDLDQLHAAIGHRLDTSGMTTTGVMSCLRVLLEHAGLRETDVNLMLTGGPDGDLGANQIQSFRGRICLIVDGGSVLFDPAGLDRDELLRIAMARHTSPRLNSLAYPEARLGPGGFRVPRANRAFRLPDGTQVPDGAFFHRQFLVNPELRPHIAAANLQAFVPCGGFKDTVNAENVHAFIDLFRELRVIVEGANVFFDDAARDTIARQTSILQLRDSSANKGGVTCSSVAEVLSGFLLGDDYDRVMADPAAKAKLVHAVFGLVRRNAEAETRMLLNLHRRTGMPLHQLSVRTSEMLLDLQERLSAHLDEITRGQELVESVLRDYVPGVLIDWVGMPQVRHILNTPQMLAYRNAILSKKLAAAALYRHADEWESMLRRFEAEPLATIESLAAATTTT